MDIASLLIPLLLTGAALWALRKRIDVYDALTAGASEGLLVLARIAPSLIALLTAVYMLRAGKNVTIRKKRTYGCAFFMCRRTAARSTPPP